MNMYVEVVGRKVTKMTKKHSVAFAKAIKDRYEHQDARISVENMAHLIADVCSQFNNNFDRDKFIRACGVVKSD